MLVKCHRRQKTKITSPTRSWSSGISSAKPIFAAGGLSAVDNLQAEIKLIRWSRPATDKSNVILEDHHGGMGGFLKVSLVSGIDNPCISFILEEEPSTINP